MTLILMYMLSIGSKSKNKNQNPKAKKKKTRTFSNLLFIYSIGKDTKAGILERVSAFFAV